jgi:hypothetical protein
VDALENFGAEGDRSPDLRADPPEDEAVERAAASVNQYAWVVLVSQRRDALSRHTRARSP